MTVGFGYRTTGIATPPITTHANRLGSYVRMWSGYISHVNDISYLLPLPADSYHLYRLKHKAGYPRLTYVTKDLPSLQVGPL